MADLGRKDFGEKTKEVSTFVRPMSEKKPKYMDEHDYLRDQNQTVVYVASLPDDIV